jgi:hypothetical protein
MNSGALTQSIEKRHGQQILLNNKQEEYGNKKLISLTYSLPQHQLHGWIHLVQRPVRADTCNKTSGGQWSKLIN